MSIQKFYNTAYNNDFARQFQFKLSRFGPITFSPEHYVYVETASLPGRQINSVPVPYMGLQFNTPGTVSYPGSDNWAVTFRCDKDYRIRDALEHATFRLFDDQTSTGAYGMPDQGQVIVLELLNKAMATIRSYTLYGAWVKSLEASNYDIKDGGAIQTISCSLAYQFWRVTKGNAPSFNPVTENWNSTESTGVVGIKPAGMITTDLGI